MKSSTTWIYKEERRKNTLFKEKEVWSHILIDFPTLMSSVGGWVFSVDVTRGVGGISGGWVDVTRGVGGVAMSGFIETNSLE